MKYMGLSVEEVQELSRRIRLKILHEDSDVLLVTAPNDDELVKIVRELLGYRCMNLKEIHQILSGIASEDKIRKALNLLIDQGEAYMNEDGRYVITSF
ncbi:MAG: ArsR family transcriptional regulator [Desulfurococcaceae archaeon]